MTVPMRQTLHGASAATQSAVRHGAREVVSGGINLGCRGLLDRRPDRIHIHTTLSDGFFVDIDTPEAYAVEIGASLPASAS